MKISLALGIGYFIITNELGKNLNPYIIAILFSPLLIYVLRQFLAHKRSRKIEIERWKEEIRKLPYKTPERLALAKRFLEGEILDMSEISDLIDDDMRDFIYNLGYEAYNRYVREIAKELSRSGDARDIFYRIESNGALRYVHKNSEGIINSEDNFNSKEE